MPLSQRDKVSVFEPVLRQMYDVAIIICVLARVPFLLLPCVPCALCFRAEIREIYSKNSYRLIFHGCQDDATEIFSFSSSSHIHLLFGQSSLSYNVPGFPVISLSSRCLLPVADFPLLVEISRTCHAGVQNAAVAVAAVATADYKISVVGRSRA